MPSPLQLANLLAYILNIVITYVAGAGGFGGKTTGAVARENDCIIGAAGWAIGTLWGVIFLGEGIFSVWQVLPAQRDSRVLRAIGWCWVAACVFQCGWMLTWTRSLIWVATILLCAIAVSLGIAYVRLYQSSNETKDGDDVVDASYVDVEEQQTTLSMCSGASTVGSPASDSLTGWWTTVLPLSIHFTWACAASLLNINVCAASDLGASVSTQYGVAITSLVVLFVGAATLAWTRADPVVSAVAAWALFAIADKQNGYTSDPLRLQQGSEYRDFDLASIHNIAAAAFVVASIHAFASVVMMILAALRHHSSFARTAEQGQPDGSAVTGQHSKVLSA